MRWGDMDALGHLNNTVYFRYMEQARVEWFEQLGFPLRGHGEGMLIVNADCNFRRAITYPAEVEVLMFVGQPGRSSLPTYYELRDAAAPDRLYADGRAMAVWVDYDLEQSRPLPAPLRRHLEPR